MKETLAFWEDVKAGKYEVIISEVVTQEVSNCPEPKRSKMLTAIEEIQHTVIYLTDEIEDLADEIVRRKILTAKSLDDCFHIATAITEGCDMIVSWNFKHIVNRKTMQGVKEVTISSNYRSVEIYAPPMLTSKED